MSHLLLILGAIGGFLGACIGVCMFGDAFTSRDTSSTGTSGCATFMVGAVIFALCFSALMS